LSTTFFDGLNIGAITLEAMVRRAHHTSARFYGLLIKPKETNTQHRQDTASDLRGSLGMNLQGQQAHLTRTCLNIGFLLLQQRSQVSPYAAPTYGRRQPIAAAPTAMNKNLCRVHKTSVSLTGIRI
jgi:hypothetical protein